MILLAVVVCGKPSSIFVFGCDGQADTADFAKEDLGKCHYACDEKCVNKRSWKYPKTVRRERENFKSLMTHMEKIFNIKVPPIYIAGLHSLYDFGEKVSHEECLRLIEE